ncbi:hypothetical protein HYDPIDRAFT_83602 [Hydnomerulius pinastri MD-312]|nr:hypothetical protein HYDPIDRAFT_83602 [Hydnomerulius pinastri MD-312]
MLFAKGPRFAPEKIPDVPGPNSYNPLQDSQLDAYKRGAFLEKADRFSKDKPSDAPGPGSSAAKERPPSRTSRPPTATGKHPVDDRYAVLLKRIEELERVHADDKKQHQADLDRHKSELARLTKTNTEQSERLDRLKKQNEGYELRAQELKKSSVAEQAEIKELRLKLRMSEHERTQLASKQGESGDVKKALSSLESKRREDLRERERKIAELEKTVAAERKKREMLESCLHDVKNKADEESVKLRANAKSLQRELEEARTDGQKTQQAASAVRGEAAGREEALLVQLEQCRTMLGRVAEEYGYLASSTVATKVYDSLKEEHITLQVRSLRLERKLANSEGQVTELANLIRQAKEENKGISLQLRDAEREIAFYSQSLHERSLYHVPREVFSLEENKLAAVRDGITECQRCILETALEHQAAAHEFYRTQSSDLQSQMASLQKAAEREHSATQGLVEEVSKLTALREASDTELRKLQTELTEATHALTKEQLCLVETRQSHDALREKITQLEKKSSDEASKLKEAAQKERDAAQKLSAQLHMSKTAEETLKEEIEQLHLELTDASRFQDAYYRLVDETEDLLARNDLAEEEAERLSRFNAEILGHNNPSQRIVYVDRIRRELAETKQTLLVCTRDRDAFAAANEDLRHELGLYKSAVVPVENKPRSLFIRVARPPLTSQSLNVNNVKTNTNMTPSSIDATKHVILEHLPGPGDMTLDELV